MDPDCLDRIIYNIISVHSINIRILLPNFNYFYWHVQDWHILESHDSICFGFLVKYFQFESTVVFTAVHDKMMELSLCHVIHVFIKEKHRVLQEFITSHRALSVLYSVTSGASISEPFQNKSTVFVLSIGSLFSALTNNNVFP